MANRNIPNPFDPFLQGNGRKNFNDTDHNTDQKESYSRESDSSYQARLLYIKRAERAKRTLLAQQAQSLYTSQQAHTNAVLERLGLSVQQGFLPSPHPPSGPRLRPKSSLLRRRIMPILNVEENYCSQTIGSKQTLCEEDPFFEKKLLLGSQMAMLACKIEKLKAKNRSPSPDAPMNSIDLQLQPEMCPTVSPTSPQKPATKRTSHIPVKTSGEVEKVADGCATQPATPKIGKTVNKLEEFQLVHLPPPQPPSAPRTTAFVPTKQTAQSNKRGPQHGPNLHPSKDDLPPLVSTSDSLSLCFRKLNSEDWEKKIDGLKTVRAMAKHNPELLQPKLHEICLVVTKEVKNLRSAVACSAMDTITELHIHLGKSMDPEAETTGRVLLLKFAETTSPFIHQHANRALEALVEGCSPCRVESVLLNTGLTHGCAAVRASTAQHLHQLTNIVGPDRILAVGKIYAERFVTAVCKMSVDAAPEVRHHGQEMLQGLAPEREFMLLLNKVVPAEDRPALMKILKKKKK